MNKLKLRIYNALNIDISWIKSNLPALIFVIVSLFFGSLFIKNIGSFSGPDIRNAHYKATLALATGQSFNKPIAQGYSRISELKGNEKYFDSGGATCSKDAIVGATIVAPLSSDGTRECIYSHDKSLSWDKTIKTTGILQYPPVGYIPQSTGLFIGMKLRFEPVHAQTIARLFNLFTYIAIIVIAIKLLPRGKWLAVGLGLLPPSLFLASSLSADALNIAWSFLFIAYILHINHKGKLINKKQKLILVVLGVALFLLKVAYAPLILLLLVLDKKVISNKHRWQLFVGTAIIGTLLYAIWSLNWSSLSATVDTGVQSNLIIHNMPKAMVGIFVNVLYAPFSILKINEQGYLLIYGALIFVFSKILKSNLFATPSRLVDFVVFYKILIIGLLVWFLSLAMTYTALLLTWTDISKHGWTGIQGFQERYLLPLLPLLLLLYYIPQKTLKKKK